MASATVEQTLPGLDPATPSVEMTTGHAIPLTPQKRLMVFSGRSHPELAEKIAEQLGVGNRWILANNKEEQRENAVKIIRRRCLIDWDNERLAVMQVIGNCWS